MGRTPVLRRTPAAGIPAVIAPPRQRDPDDQAGLLAMAGRMARLGAWTMSIADGVVHLSDGACAIVGLPTGATTTVGVVLDTYAPEVRPVIAAALAACISDGVPFDLELEIRSPHGGIPVRVIGQAVRRANGDIERIQGVLQDISALRNAEADAARLGARLARTLESVTDAFYTLDPEWRYTYVNPEAERLQQRTRAELLGRVVWEVFPEVVGTVFDAQFRRAMETRETVVFESYYPPLDLWASVRAFPSDEGLAVYFLDVSARRADEQALVASEQRYRALFERAGDAILIADESGRWVDANASASTMLGVTRDEIIGRDLSDFVVGALDGVDPAASWRALRAAGEIRGDVRLRRASGEILEAEYTAVADISPGLHLGVLRDITERRRHERSDIERVRIIDALRRLSPGGDPEASASAICAEIVDHGEFASAAIYAFGPDDGVLALGSILRGAAREEAVAEPSAERMTKLRSRASSGPWVEDVHPGHIGLDDGSAAVIAFAPIESDGQIIGVLGAGAAGTAADLTLRLPALVEFAALAASFLGPGLRRRSEQARERARLVETIASGAFRPVFQPIVELETGTVLGYEALTRFADGTPPDHIFLEAAAVGVGLELEAATIEAALQASGPLPADVFLDINVSPAMIMAVEPLRTLLRGAASGVVLEITEHARVHDYAALRRAVAELGKDVRLAVDDTGAGFASLRHILELAPAHVKLDGGLVRRIDTDPARQALVAGLVHFGEAIDAMLIAEGVETTAERDTLIRLGVRVGQGYLLGRPAQARHAVRPARERGDISHPAA